MIDDYTRVYPSNPLPFEIVDPTCPDCEKALEELNRFLPSSVPHDYVRLTLHKDSAGRGWHIQAYQLNDHEVVDLSGKNDPPPRPE